MDEEVDMHLLIALALLSSQDTAGSIGELMRQSEIQAIGEAANAWDSCLDEGVSKYEPSGEPADVVATAALWSCQAQYGALFEAQVAARVAAVPDGDERQSRQEVLEQSPMIIRGREWRVTHDVVMLRLARRQP